MHGAAYSNVLFMRNGSKMIEGMPFAWRQYPGVTYVTHTYIEPISGIHGELFPSRAMPRCGQCSGNAASATLLRAAWCDV
jgi:hypothetical protein